MYMDIGASGLVNLVVGIYEVIFGDIKSKAINWDQSWGKRFEGLTEEEKNEIII